ncbi:MAG: VWA domain-containing protein [Lentilitoribacter sp.]
MNFCKLMFAKNPLMSPTNWQAQCTEQGLAPELATLGLLLVAVTIIIWSIRLANSSYRQTGKPSINMGVFPALAALIAAGLLAIAAGGPEYVSSSQDASNHVIVVVDQSESARRQPQERTARLKEVSAFFENVERQNKQQISVSVINFAASATVRLNRSSARAANKLLKIDKPSEALNLNGSDLQTALDEAQKLAEEENDADMIILISDGNDTVIDLDDLASNVAGKIANVFVLSISAGPPLEGIVSSYLPSSIETNTKPNLRIVFDPGETNPQSNWDISLGKNGTEIPLEQKSLEMDGSLESLKLPIPFEGRGVQFAEIVMSSDEKRYAQRAFTLVESRIRVLGIGQAGFLSSLSEVEFEIEYASPNAPIDTSKYDVVVLGSVYAHQIPKTLSDRIVKGVSQGGLGLLVVNGPMQGTIESPTVIQSYDKTAIDPLLPVSPDPKFLIEEAPPRDIMVLVDTSGSMTNGGLAAARKAIVDVLGYMRPIDQIQIITFGGAVSGRLSGDAADQEKVKRFINNFSGNDQSNVKVAFEKAAQVVGNYTSVFLITDGEVNGVEYVRKGFSFYYLEYGRGGFRNRALADLASKSQLLTGAGLDFTPDSFNPEEKTEFFAPDTISPVTVTPMKGIIPGIRTSGVALSYPRVDAVRALISDGDAAEPLLVFRKAGGLGGGQTAAFLSSFDGAWTRTQEGRNSIKTILTNISKWSERERYSIEIEDLGAELEMQISVVSQIDSSKLPDELLATLVLADRSIGIPLREVNPGDSLFTGRIKLPGNNEVGARAALLVLQESGAEALQQSQSIPFMVPNKSLDVVDRGEASSFGVDIKGLEKLALIAGGAIDKLPTIDEKGIGFEVPQWPIHGIFMTLAAFLFGLALLGKGVRL